MNRERKEQIRKYKEAREGLTPEEILEVDRKDAIREEINALAEELHLKIFSEEYDRMYDTRSDMADRRRGINPMLSEYIEKVQARRAGLGVSLLGSNGLPVSDDSYIFCRKIAEECVTSRQKKEAPLIKKV